MLLSCIPFNGKEVFKILLEKVQSSATQWTSKAKINKKYFKLMKINIAWSYSRDYLYWVGIIGLISCAYFLMGFEGA